MSRKEYHIYYHGKKKNNSDNIPLEHKFEAMMKLLGFIIILSVLIWVGSLIWPVIYYGIIVPIGFLIDHWIATLVVGSIVMFLCIGCTNKN